MSTDPTEVQSEQGTDQTQGQPSEEQLRAAYEAELSRITTADMILQAAVSLLNLGGRRLGPIGDRPLRARRVSATSSRCVTRSTACGRCWGSSNGASPLRSCDHCATRCHSCRLPMRVRRRQAVARRAHNNGRPESRVTPVAEGKTGASPAADKPDAPPTEGKPGPGPAESSGRLWVPGR